MKKFFSLAVVPAVLAVSVGCDDKKTTAAKPAGASTATNTNTGTGTGTK